MKTKKHFKLLAFLLVLIMLASMIVACSGTSDDDGEKKTGETQGVDSSAKESEAEETAEPDESENRGDYENAPGLKPIDYNGYEFTFVCQPYAQDNAYTTKYMVSEGETGDLILDAVYKRNKMLSDKYNITFRQMRVDDLITTVRAQVQSGACEFDVIVGSGKNLATLAKEGRLLDLKTVEQFDLSKPYWDQNAAEQITIANKLYFTNCDFNVQELGYVAYFNKSLIEQYNLTSPYEYMEKNEWTIENWAKLVKAISFDYDGKGMTALDQYGTLFERFNTPLFLYGSGLRATTKDKNDMPVLTLMDSDNKAKTEKVYSVAHDVFSSASSWSMDDMDSSEKHGYIDKWDYARSLFCQGHYLFTYEGTNVIHQFGEMGEDLGIVPLPKFDSAQEKYYSLYHFTAAMIALPATLSGGELERTAIIFEDMNAMSTTSVQPAWFDNCLKGLYAHDVNAELTLDLVKAGRVYDVGLYYNFGDINNSLLDKDVRGITNIATTYKRVEKAVESDIKVVYRDFSIQ